MERGGNITRKNKVRMKRERMVEKGEKVVVERRSAKSTDGS